MQPDSVGLGPEDAENKPLECSSLEFIYVYSTIWFTFLAILLLKMISVSGPA